MTAVSEATTASLTIPELFDLKGQGAVVTGGGLGIGQAIAYRLAEAGAAVLVADINLEAARETADQIVAQGNRALTIQADVSAVADAQRVAQEAVSAFGHLDILVNDAGVFPFTPALEVDESRWDRVLGINLKGAFFFAQAAARQMIAQGREGKIINIASIDALHPTGGLVAYDASKGGMVMLTEALAREWGQYGIRVNAIAPGGINTPGAASAMAQEMAGASADATQSFLARIPLGRMGMPDNIATAALFLASQAASYVTGSLLVVDGGYLLS